MKTYFSDAHQSFIWHKHLEVRAMFSNVEYCTLPTESRESCSCGCLTLCDGDYLSSM